MTDDPGNNHPEPQQTSGNWSSTAHGHRSVAARDIYGNVTTGDIHVHVPELTPVVDVQAPPGLNNLPSRPQLFVGHKEVLRQLDNPPKIKEDGNVHVICGLGGIGKTTLVARWAANQTAGSSLVWWITADTPDRVNHGLSALAEALQPELQGVISQHALKVRATQWLSSHTDWVVILDDVRNPEDIRPLLAQANGGRFLITTRRATGWHDITTQVVELEVLKRQEATTLLTAIATQASSRAMDGCDDLCVELGDLPLALEQAGAFIAETAITPRTYIELLARYPAQIYQWTAEGGEAERTIARVWNVTMAKLSDDPLTGRLLRILSWYAPDAIPRTLIADIADPTRLLNAVGRLNAYSMVKLTSDDISVHRLVQAVSRTPATNEDDPYQPPEVIRAAEVEAVGLLKGALPPIHVHEVGQMAQWALLIPHIDAFLENANAETDTLDHAHLFLAAGDYLSWQSSGKYAIKFHLRAQSYFRSARERDGHHEHHNVKVTLSLAEAYREAGDLLQALKLYAEVLNHGSIDGDHFLVLINDIGLTYQMAGDYDNARQLFERVLPQMIQRFGSTDRRVLTTSNNLAQVYCRTSGLEDRAIPLFEQVLMGRRAMLGDEHYETLITASDLAYARGRVTGDWQQATEQLRRIVSDFEQIYGTDYVHTMVTRNELANALRYLGDLDGAIVVYEQVYHAYQKMPVAEYPRLLTACLNLADAYSAKGNMAEAAELYEEAFTQYKRIHVPDHSEIVIVARQAAESHQAYGNSVRALELYREILAIASADLGEDHEYTQDIRRVIADLTGPASIA